MWPSRAIFPEPAPLVCVPFFTCKGTNVAGTVDLEQSYPEAVRYLELQRHAGEPLRYELVWLDNGGDAAARDDFVRRGAQMERVLANPTNEGLFRAVNDVWFRGRGCRALACHVAQHAVLVERGVAGRPAHARPAFVPRVELGEMRAANLRHRPTRRDT